jgi:hypothetical protein
MYQFTFEEVKNSIDYDPLSGTFFRKSKIKSKNGKPAGYIDGGYLLIKINGKKITAARIAWILQTGEWPTKIIDHINGNKLDNRFVNLREATPAQNSQNRKIPIHNTSGITGVSWNKDKKKWSVQIKASNKGIWFGYFASKEEAIAVRHAAEIKYFGDYVRIKTSIDEEDGN